MSLFYSTNWLIILMDAARIFVILSGLPESSSIQIILSLQETRDSMRDIMCLKVGFVILQSAEFHNSQAFASKLKLINGA